MRQNADGAYLFLGRKDHQIKSRGTGSRSATSRRRSTRIHTSPTAPSSRFPMNVVGNRIKAVVAARDINLTALSSSPVQA